MIVKIILLFLVVVAVLGMFGRLKLNLPGGRQLVKCRHCGRYVLGKGPCSCRSGPPS